MPHLRVVVVIIYRVVFSRKVLAQRLVAGHEWGGMAPVAVIRPAGPSSLSALLMPRHAAVDDACTFATPARCDSAAVQLLVRRRCGAVLTRWLALRLKALVAIQVLLARAEGWQRRMRRRRLERWSEREAVAVGSRLARVR